VASTWTVRRQPCTGCGDKIVIVETKLSGFGGVWKRKDPIQVQHADFEPGAGRVDRIDADCRRPPVGVG
jgi:hypothetical protein